MNCDAAGAVKKPYPPWPTAQMKLLSFCAGPNTKLLSGAKVRKPAQDATGRVTGAVT